jgi:hypothetical protein
MAGAGYKLFNTGDVLTAAQVNTYLMEQTVMVFADAAARTTALSGVVSEGMISYLKDTNAVEVYNGSAWVSSDDPNAIQNTIVDAKGDLITATAADTPARLAVGANETRLVADSAAASGLKYVADTTNYAIAAKGDLLAGTAADTLAPLSIGTDYGFLTAWAAASEGMKWENGGWTNYASTVTSQSGTITSYTSDIKYLRVGKMLAMRIYITITNAGTGGGYLQFTIPFNIPNSANTGAGTGREGALTGNALTVLGVQNTNALRIWTYNNGSVIGTNAVIAASWIGEVQ